MKKIITLCVALFIFTFSFSQFEKDSKRIAGSVNFNYNSFENNPQPNFGKGNNFSFGIRPTFSSFKTEKQMNSFFVGYSFNSTKNENSTDIAKSNLNSFQIGISRTYIQPLFGKVYSTVTTSFFGGFATQNNEANSKTSSNFNSSRSTIYSLNTNLGLGLMYRVNDRFAVSTSINNILYVGINFVQTKTNANGTIENSAKSVGVNGGLGLSGFNLGNLQIGLMYRLQKKK